MMKKMMGLALVAGLVVAACNKNGTATTVCTVADPSTEDGAIRSYISSHGYSATKDTTLGIYYQILAPGTGARPTTSSTVTVAYTGRLLNDAGFDSSSSVALGLANTIVGWQRGVPKLRAGGAMRLIIPSAYGYGCRAQGSTIPANSPLYFDIRLLQVN